MGLTVPLSPDKGREDARLASQQLDPLVQSTGSFFFPSYVLDGYVFNLRDHFSPNSMNIVGLFLFYFISAISGKIPHMACNLQNSGECSYCFADRK